MSTPFLGQVMLVGFDWVPNGFAACNGQLLAISQNQALFSLLGTTYGGDGVTTFALPNMQSRTPSGMAAANRLGEMGGVENVTLSLNQIPTHTHLLCYSGQTGSERDPSSSLLGNTGSHSIYAPATGPQITTNGNTISPQGQSQPHDNMQPYTTLNFVICISGIFPSQN